MALKNPRRCEYARRMRQQPTLCERILLSKLKSVRHDCGWKLCPQTVLGPFIVDILISNLRVVVEVDGSSHLGREVYDAERDEWLRQHGFRVIHVQNEDVLKHPDKVVYGIFQFAGLGRPKPKRLRKYGPLTGVPKPA